MAALRYAAGRLVGRTLQRTQAVVVSPAVEEEQRRLLPRLIHTKVFVSLAMLEGEHDFSGFPANHLCAEPAALAHDEKMYTLRKIQKMKEDLYNLIAEADKKNMTLGGVGRQIRELLQHLSVQVEPKPNDPEWYNLKHICSCIYMLPVVCLFKKAKLYPYLCMLLPPSLTLIQNGHWLSRSVYIVIIITYSSK